MINERQGQAEEDALIKTLEFKKRTRTAKRKRQQKDQTIENKEGITYQVNSNVEFGESVTLANMKKHMYIQSLPKKLR